MSRAKTASVAGGGAKKMTLKRFKRYIPIYCLMLPGLLYLFINNYMPLPGLVLAFKKYSTKKGIWGSPWVGLKNFKYLTKKAAVNSKLKISPLPSPIYTHVQIQDLNNRLFRSGTCIL